MISTCISNFCTHHSCVSVSGRSTCRWWNFSSLKSWWAFPPSHGCNSHTWLLEDFPGYNFNRFHLSVILRCNKMWQTYALLVLFFSEPLVALFAVMKKTCSSHAEKVDRNLKSVNSDLCLITGVKTESGAEIEYLKKMKLFWLFAVTRVDVCQNLKSDKQLFYLRPHRELEMRLQQRTGRRSLYILGVFVWALTPMYVWFPGNSETENVPTFFGSHPWHFWSVDIISL